ncbi:MAG: PQQ-dependent sugar dehydrogenase [Actinomycetota bacterium]
MLRSRTRRSTATVAILAIATAASVVPAQAATPRLTFRAVVANASFPTNLAFAPDGRAFYTEKDTGNIRVIDANGSVMPKPFATVPVDGAAEMGLLGLALHPDFAANPWVYAYYSDARDGHNHLVRIRADGDVGGAPQNLLTLLPTVTGYHNGGDLAFGTDGTLFVAVGEGHVADRAQDPSSLGGKILRLNDDGSIPADNPFGADSPVYAMGIRNSFGLCVARGGTLWETENGPDAWDELNRIEPGGNYGWPDHLGPGAADGFTPPVFAWHDVIVPTGCAVDRTGSIYVGDFHGDLHLLSFPSSGPSAGPSPGPSSGRATPTDTLVAGFDAGITDVKWSPDGRLYVVTSNGIWVRSGATSGGPFTPAGIVVLIALVALLYVMRRRLDGRGR